MADQQAPNDASRKSKAEGERWDQPENAPMTQPTDSATNDREEVVDRRGDERGKDRDDDPVMPTGDATANTKI